MTPDEVTPKAVSPSAPDTPSETVASWVVATPGQSVARVSPGICLPKMRSPWELFLDHNPFYLLSVLSMLFGCYAINNSLQVTPGDWGKLLLLLGILNLYEFLLIGLGMYLLPRKGVERDGRILLLLETLFLVDATFLNAETVMTSPTTGALINLLLLGLAVVKVGVILRAMRLRMAGWRFGFLALQLAILWAMPFAFLKMGPDGEISPLTIFGVWWVVGLLPVLYDLVVKMMPSTVSVETLIRDSAAARVSPWVGKVYVVAPFVSLLAHLGFIHWIYQIPFYMTDLSPILFGIAVNIAYWKSTTFAGGRDLVAMRIFLPILAILFALSNPSELQLHLFGRTLEPVYVIILGAYLTLVYGFAFRQFLWFFLAAVLVALAKFFGPTVAQISQGASSAVKQADGWVNKLIPQTATGWGVVAMVGSFVLLALGGAVSYIKGQRAK